LNLFIGDVPGGMYFLRGVESGVTARFFIER
jgi:hypothetical protein